MANLCEGRVAIVTGAARGVGKENALLLAKEGARLVVNDLGGAVDGAVGVCSRRIPVERMASYNTFFARSTCCPNPEA